MLLALSSRVFCRFVRRLEQVDHRLGDAEITRGHQHQHAVVSVLEGGHFPKGIDLIDAGVGARIRQHHKTGVDQQADAISHGEIVPYCCCRADSAISACTLGRAWGSQVILERKCGDHGGSPAKRAAKSDSRIRASLQACAAAASCAILRVSVADLGRKDIQLARCATTSRASPVRFSVEGGDCSSVRRVT